MSTDCRCVNHKKVNDIQYDDVLANKPVIVKSLLTSISIWVIIFSHNCFTKILINKNYEYNFIMKITCHSSKSLIN